MNHVLADNFIETKSGVLIKVGQDLFNNFFCQKALIYGQHNTLWKLIHFAETIIRGISLIQEREGEVSLPAQYRLIKHIMAPNDTSPFLIYSFLPSIQNRLHLHGVFSLLFSSACLCLFLRPDA